MRINQVYKGDKMTIQAYELTLGLCGMNQIQSDLMQSIKNEYAERNIHCAVSYNDKTETIETVLRIETQDTKAELAKKYAVDEFFQIVCSVIDGVNEKLSFKLIDAKLVD